MRTSLASRFLIAAALLLGTTAAAHAQDSCDATSFSGAFGYSLKGSVYDRSYNVYLLAAAGRIVADGAGNITGADTISYDGSAVRRKLTGTYTVNADCTGTLVLRGDDTSVTNADFVIVNDGKEVSIVQTDDGYILSGDLKRQKSVVAAAAPAAPAQ
ncbi:MAG TPA: hypothetical protein VGK29_04345 [Paludibaculum sp.]|jgi:hypothetical protein